jgi:hypothetical protein
LRMPPPTLHASTEGQQWADCAIRGLLSGKRALDR